MSHALHECVNAFVPLGYEVLREDYDGAPSDVFVPMAYGSHVISCCGFVFCRTACCRQRGCDKKIGNM